MNAAQSLRLDRIIEASDFWGVVQVTHPDGVLYQRTAGFADRAREMPNAIDTQFAIASGAKGFTALAVMSLVTEGALALETKIPEVLKEARDLVAPETTVRHLLAHTSGMGDYLDESAIANIEDHMLEVPVQRLTRPADFLPLFRGRPARFPPGTSFAYCNSGYVLLALVTEAVSGQSFYDVVEERVFAPAGMRDTAFLRLDNLPPRAAIGYLPRREWQVNHLHLPVRGGGDGGAYSTADDFAQFWTALFAGSIVPPAAVLEMTRSQCDDSPASHRYGLGFWLTNGSKDVFLEGSDPGISFRSTFDPSTRLLYSVLSNTTSGAWPVVKEIDAILKSPSKSPQGP